MNKEKLQSPPNDGIVETRRHIANVVELGGHFLLVLKQQLQRHDASKLESPEKDTQPAIEYHCSHNRHHPEYHKDGVSGMNLFDIIEMLLDWKAASLRMKNGSFRGTIEQQMKKFKIDPQLANILKNTIDKMSL